MDATNQGVIPMRQQHNVKRSSGLVAFSYAKALLAIDFEAGAFVPQLPRVQHFHTTGLAPLKGCPDRANGVPVIHRHPKLRA